MLSRHPETLGWSKNHPRFLPTVCYPSVTLTYTPLSSHEFRIFSGHRISRWSHPFVHSNLVADMPERIVLADPPFYQSSKIDILIWIEGFFEAIRFGKCTMGANIPTLINTSFAYYYVAYWTWAIQMQFSSRSTLSRWNHFWKVEDF